MDLKLLTQLLLNKITLPDSVSGFQFLLLKICRRGTNYHSMVKVKAKVKVPELVKHFTKFISDLYGNQQKWKSRVNIIISGT